MTEYEMNEMLKFYGFENLEELENEVGLYGSDAKRFLKEMYEEDTAELRQ